MKKLFYIMIGMALLIVAGASLTSVSQVDGDALHTIQSGWAIAESENSADTQAAALGKSQRMKKRLDALIAANANEEAQISIMPIPAKWNAIRLRAIGITENGTVTHEIYFGTLGGGLDCDLTYAGQLAWIIGQQQDIYYQITFTSGGTYIPQIGDTVTGNTSGETAVIVSIAETASTWSAGTAAGTVTYRSASGTFTNSETVSILRARKVLSNNAYTHAASDLIDFELADTLVLTAKAWGADWSEISPVGELNAEASVDVKGADFMVVVTSATSADSKLLIRGY
jgi:hypothetical protein